jgi:hypothetical protein
MPGVGRQNVGLGRIGLGLNLRRRFLIVTGASFVTTRRGAPP